jgi:hypothetical protein
LRNAPKRTRLYTALTEVADARPGLYHNRDAPKMSSTYAEPDAQMSGTQGPYANHAETPPAQQQQQQQHLTDPELRLQENLQQLREGGDMMHAHPQQPQYQHLAQMPPTMGAHQHFQSPARPTHSPQQMAHAVMSLEGQHDPYDPNDPNRKRSKVSRACDECRRKKVRTGTNKT